MRLILSSLIALTTVAGLQAQAVKVDNKLPQYRTTAGVTGNLNSVGSDSLNNLMSFWVESFSKKYPSVRIQVEGKGSGTAPPALIEATAQLGPMSRAMTSDEIDKFKARFGYEPTRISVAIDTLAVFVHKDNPIKQLSLQQLDGIFSKTFRSGNSDIRNWDQVGLSGNFQGRPISMYGRNAASGTYGYFKEVALFKGDYKDTVKEQPGSSAVVQGVTGDGFGIGYSGIGYLTSGVKTVPLSKTATGQAYEANYENALNGNYPLARYLYIYINKPQSGLTPIVREFIKFILSKEGQEIVVKDGYLPLTAAMSETESKKL